MTIEPPGNKAKSASPSPIGGRSADPEPEADHLPACPCDPGLHQRRFVRLKPPQPRQGFGRAADRDIGDANLFVSCPYAPYAGASPLRREALRTDHRRLGQ